MEQWGRLQGIPSETALLCFCPTAPLLHCSTAPMPDALATALAQFGLAGFVAWMWLTERRATQTREKQIGDLHDRLMQERRGTDALLGALERSTAAMTALQEGQKNLAAAIERLAAKDERASRRSTKRDAA